MTGDQVALSGLGARNGGPRHRIVAGKVKSQNVSPAERDPPVVLERYLVEPQLSWMEVGLTNQRVVTGDIFHRYDVTLMT